MSGRESHPSDDLQLLIDGRLSPTARAAVETHLLGCARCRRELDALREVKAAARERLRDLAVPGELVARVSAALGSAAATASRPSPRRRVWRRAVLGLGLAAAAVVVALLVRPGRRDFVAAAAGDLSRYREAQLVLQLETGEAGRLEQFLARGGLPFSTRVFDLGMMGYRLRGGGVHRIAGRRSALFVYEADDGSRVLCQMYEGLVSELPPAAEEREHEGVRFRVYRRAGLTLVFWQEGSVVCVLAADGDPEALIQLAYAKAVKA